MTIPVATYRLQLRNGTTFADAAKLAPYLARIGISHVYLSPIFQATPQSTHGYDAIDFNEIESALGGLQGLLDLVDELEHYSLKVIVDFVPNHMAAHPVNAWWCDVLEWGPLSRYSEHFDIDWSAPKLLVAILGKQYGVCLQDQEISIEFADATGEFAARYFDYHLPLTPASYGRLLDLTKDEEIQALSDEFARCDPISAPGLKQRLTQVARSKQQQIEQAIQKLNSDVHAVHTILEEQPWRLAYWRTAREMLTYRRFFEISDLVGVRVENSDVFADVHRTVLDLIRKGKIDGLRIDHIDGLADPLKYLRQLRRATDEIPGFYLVVEKILGENEDVRPQWPIDGTTGYEFIREIGRLFVDSDLHRLDKEYSEFTGSRRDYHAETLDVKRRTLSFNLASELNGLVSLAFAVAQADVKTRDFGRDTLRSTIIEIAAHFPVYRTYIDATGPSVFDDDILQSVSQAAKMSRRTEDPAAVDFIIALLASGPNSFTGAPETRAFTRRFQQTTGPLMAKAVEDTEFYRFNRSIALNEVGGDPSVAETGPDQFHAAMKRRQSLSPRALTSTATHDTKRGEDARTRLYAISTFQEEWCEAVWRWSAKIKTGRSKRGLDQEMEWLFYQALAGAWPATDAVSEDLVARILQFMLKAAREAKQHTSWTNPDDSYEAILEKFVRETLDTPKFLDDFSTTIKPLLAAGAALSLVQTVLKIFVPGIPDIYQGTELWDLALVDPDNRRPVDYQLRSDLISASESTDRNQTWLDGSIKLELLRASLALRGRIALTEASYEPLLVEGMRASRTIAFTRRTASDFLIMIGTIASTADCKQSGRGFDAEAWQGANVRLPSDLKGRRFANLFCGSNMSAEGDHINVAQVLGHLPVAVLYSIG